MKTIYKNLHKASLAMLTSAALLCASLQVSAAEFTLPAYQKTVLDNGLTIYLMEQDEVPLIEVVAMVKVGAVNDSKAGLAEITASNLLLGTQALEREAFQETLDFIGTNTNSGASLEYSFVSASLASKDASVVMPLLKDVITAPALRESEFTQLKTRYLAGLERQKESPRAKIGTFFNALVYGSHPYANSVSGSVSSVSGITLSDVKAFHQQWYRPENTAIVVAGDFDSAQMLKELKKLFATWSQSATSASKSPTANTLMVKVANLNKARVLLVNKEDATESTFYIGGKGIKRSNKDFVAVSVINTILGGRFTSWLNDELRVNSGLTYGARSRFSSNKDAGTFLISTFTRTETTTEAIDLALKTYEKLWKAGIDSDTLESAKAYVKGQFPPRYETASQLAFLLGQMFVYDFDESFINTFSQQVNELSVEKSKKIIQEYFPKENLQFVIIGKAEAIKEQVQKYGEVIEADIKDDELVLP
ncbi:insulinase family protein [Glaciecola sp. MH2013]|uniref:M16 family metallopeptidase n=1 Tax=Glaciecola sp. MH2013 TaxID=2785524 RepID=UPI00189F97A0|nr:pitrilysin family protein [Glaciecola sp. MH2013]MBF7071822.1 insulinase family protein [Glaciecola sp. MH2013]